MNENSDLGELIDLIQDAGRELGEATLGDFDDNILTAVDGGLTVGFDGNDELFGSLGDDNAISGGPGNDTITTFGGDDLITSGTGNDRIVSGKGDDTIEAGADNDRVFGNAGTDVIFGGTGDDTIVGGNGNDRIDAGEGRNYILGGDGIDALFIDGDVADYRFTEVSGNRFRIDARDGDTAIVTDGVEQIRDENGTVIDTTTDFGTFTLQVLHASDLEGNTGAIANAPNFAAIVETLEDGTEADGSLILSSGDNYIPGPFFSAAAFNPDDPEASQPITDALQDVYGEILGDDVDVSELITQSGAPDIAIMNAIGFDASAIGNHEFDAGPDTFASIISQATNEDGELTNVGALFPYLAANLTVEEGSEIDDIFSATGLDADADQTTAVAPWVIQETGGEEIGIIGATPNILGSITSPGEFIGTDPSEDDVAALAEVLQASVDAIEAQGVDKIILTSHLQQFALEQELATLLDGVDIILAGGSDTILADDTDRLREGDEAGLDYPFVTEDLDGDDVVIVSTDGTYSYVGNLEITFDAGGNIIVDSIDEDVSGAYATDEQGVLDVTGAESVEEAIDASESASQVRTITSAIEEVVGEAAQNFVGSQSVPLNGERGSVRTEETNLGNLTADANLAKAEEILGEEVLVSYKNGGGIRAPIPGTIADGNIEDGLVSQLEVDTALAFNNGLVVLSITPDELLAILDNGLEATAFGDDGLATDTQGRFPQVGGINFSYDPFAEDNTARVQDVVITFNDDDASNDVLLFDDRELQTDAFDDGFNIVTLNFLVNTSGSDDPEFAPVGTDRRNLFAGPDDADLIFTDEGSEQDALADFLSENFPVGGPAFDDADTPIGEDTRIVNLAVQDDLSAAF